MEAMLINIHQLGGVNQAPVLEVCVASGYGARWTTTLSTDGQSSNPSKCYVSWFFGAADSGWIFEGMETLKGTTL